ncbi:2OG-Fe(II) oxygenase [Pontixanthobacter sp. CEM42]|uniref:2OG-Fe(II) oxygenase n=1 Tax=Pontixanthobacter sp. CEM42 TaxID=2792077 RepID=UPI001AE0D4E6|nr:2OG-Fe(II) oxygenase [Pontixanthobacter sp. CEM42]
MSGPKPTADDNRPLFTQFAALDGFLGTEQSAKLLEFALDNEAKFAPAEVASPDSASEIDRQSRRSWQFQERLGDIGQMFRQTVRNRMVDLFTQVGLRPIDEPTIELSLAAHRDGGFFAPHIDTYGDGTREYTQSDRVLSAVYYFHRQPAGFGGGELAIMPIGGYAPPALIEPKHDRLALFPSFAPHEVLPITVPGNAFADARFSINCWVRKSRS